jgi:hypothetical protein
MGTIVADLGHFWELIHVIAYIVGGCFVAAGFFVMAKDSRRMGFGIGSIVIGTLLLGLPTVVAAVAGTFFGSESAILSNGQFVQPQGATELVRGVLAFVMVVGLLGIFKGLTILRKLGEGSGASAAHAFTYIVGGACCMNIVALLKAVANTLGQEAELSRVIMRLLGS